MNELEELVDRYCRAWSVESGETRAQLLRQSLTEDASYSDPGVHELSVTALEQHITGFRDTLVGVVIRRTSVLDVHHHFARFSWAVLMPDGSDRGEGADTVELDLGRSRLRRIVGFFGPLSPLPRSE